MTAGPRPASFLLDGAEVPFEPGESVMAAAMRAGRPIPHLCWHPRLGESGACRVCVVNADGRLAAACTTRARPGLNVECRTAELAHKRRLILQLLFAQGDHDCPACEKSGGCALQSAAYEAGVAGPRFDELFTRRAVDASHPDVWLDLNRCILCKLCVRASHEIDGKDVFAISGHGAGTRVVVNSPSGRLGDSALAAADFAAQVCPVGAILPKRRGFAVPIGARPADRRHAPPVAVAPGPRRGPKLRLATTSLGGCFGCHMSLLDMDERLLPLLEHVEFDRSPLTDIKHCGACDVGLVEGGLVNSENVAVLREFRARCRVLVAVGACALDGGLPAQRNGLDVRCLMSAVYGAHVPNDPELPLPLARVHPIREVVHVDHFLPGCPPDADAFLALLAALLEGRTPEPEPARLHYD